MIIYGKNTVKEAIIANRLVYIIYTEHSFKDKEIENLIRINNLKHKTVSKHELNNLANQGVHQGVVAQVEDYVYQPLDILFDGTKKKVVILENIEDPHNFGAIIRTSEAASVDAIIIKNRQQVPITPTVAKIASGALEYMNIISVPNLNRVVDIMKQNEFWIIGSALEGKEDFRNIDKDRNIAIVIGSEGFGMSYMLKKSCDHLVKIPMEGTVNSLNASVAAALLIYQMKQLI